MMDTLTAKELAERAGVTPTTVRNWIHKGIVKPIIVGSKIVAISAENIDPVLFLSPLIACIKHARDALDCVLNRAIDAEDMALIKATRTAILELRPALAAARLGEWPDLNEACKLVALAGLLDPSLHVYAGELATATCSAPSRPTRYKHV